MELKLCLALSALVGLATASIGHNVTGCPADLARDRYLRRFRDSCYTFHTTTRSDYPTAERTCEARNGHLVIIRDAETQQFLYGTLVDDFHYRSVVWIGLSDVATENHFVWVDGSNLTYTNWAPGQPGLLGGLEDCVGMDMHAAGMWNDYRCEGIFFFASEHIFVCEHPIGGPAVVTTAQPALPDTTAAPSAS